jgi:hypothetical protein
MMKKYTVMIKEIEIYIIEDVEAESEGEAEGIAWDMLERSNGKQIYHSDSDAECEAYEKQ